MLPPNMSESQIEPAPTPPRPVPAFIVGIVSVEDWQTYLKVNRHLLVEGRKQAAIRRDIERPAKQLKKAMQMGVSNRVKQRAIRLQTLRAIGALAKGALNPNLKIIQDALSKAQEPPPDAFNAESASSSATSPAPASPSLPPQADHPNP